MEHNEAIKIGAAEKYVLHELSDELRDAYEEHFFDCLECAADIKAATIFAETTRDVFEQEGHHPAKETSKQYGSIWSRWLRPVISAPAFAMPVLAALLLLVGYQNLVTIPQLKSGSAPSVQVLNTFSLAAANSRGTAAVRIATRRNESFALDFDIPPTKDFPKYLCQLRDASGRVLRQVSVTAAQANKTVELFVPAGIMPPGTYSIVIAGAAEQDVQFRDHDEVARLSFEMVSAD
jgi:hypothetical protein